MADLTKEQAAIARKVADALRVIVLSPEAQAWLNDHDPMALRQGIDALNLWNLHRMDAITAHGLNA